MKKNRWSYIKAYKVATVFIVCVSVAILGGCTAQEDDSVEPESLVTEQIIPVEVIEVDRGSLSPSKRLIGEVSPKTSTLIFPKVGGTLQHLFIKKGDTVQANQVLGELDKRDYLLVLKDAEARLGEVQSRLEQAQVGQASSTEGTQLEQLKKLLHLAEANYQRTQSLVEEGVIPPIQLENAEAELLRAQQNVLASETAEARDIAGIEVAKQGVKQAEVHVEKAQTALQDTQIKAPVKGIIAELSVREGDLLNPQQALAKIIDLDPVLVSVQVLEQQLSAFHLGQELEIYIPSLAKKSKGKVLFIGLEADQMSQMFEVEIEIANPERDILSGMKADVFVEEQSQQEGILIPAEAIVEEEAQKYVYTINEERASKRAIQLLDSNSEWLLVDGLDAGDRVIVKGLEQIEDQAKVRIIDSLESTLQ